MCVYTGTWEGRRKPTTGTGMPAAIWKRLRSRPRPRGRSHAHFAAGRCRRKRGCAKRHHVLWELLWNERGSGCIDLVGVVHPPIV